MSKKDEAYYKFPDPPEGFDLDMSTTSLVTLPNGHFDAFQARKIAYSGSNTKTDREMGILEEKIREAAYNDELCITVKNLYPESVKELENRGFVVKPIKRNPYADPVNDKYRSVESQEYLISWCREECLQ